MNSTLVCKQLNPILPISDILTFQKLIHSSPIQQWYGRETHWTFKYSVLWDSSLYFDFDFPLNHNVPLQVLQSLQSLTQTFLQVIFSFSSKDEEHLRQNQRRIFFECYLDRNRVTKENMIQSDLFYHRDRIKIGDKQMEYADFSLILLLNDHITWKGGDILLEKGGYRGGHSYQEWIRTTPTSQEEKKCIHLQPHEGLIFRNDNSLHAVTALSDIPQEGVNRDVFVLTCYFEKIISKL